MEAQVARTCSNTASLALAELGGQDGRARRVTPDGGAQPCGPSQELPQSEWSRRHAFPGSRDEEYDESLSEVMAAEDGSGSKARRVEREPSAAGMHHVALV
eukprot:4550023-Alexandrium_andersonii.AAC.1